MDNVGPSYGTALRDPKQDVTDANLISVAEIAAAKIAAAAADAADAAAAKLAAAADAAAAKVSAAATFAATNERISYAANSAPYVNKDESIDKEEADAIVSKINDAVTIAISKVAAAQPPLPPTTTTQEDITFAGQRRINLIWEYTQAFIALSVVLANVGVGAVFGIYRIPSGEYPAVLSSSLFLVIGFYFSRTNHAAIGGVGAKAEAPYEGR